MCHWDASNSNITCSHLEYPNRIVLDLDPGPRVRSVRVVEAAHLVRSIIHELGLESFVKTTGGVGYHVVVPLLPKVGWNDCLTFARAVAEMIVDIDQTRYTIELPKAGREDKILIDYLRNNRTNTSVAAFSTRARRTAAVSVPLTWQELKPGMRSDKYTVITIGKRPSTLRKDPWEDYWKVRQQITSKMMAAVTKLSARD